MTRNGCPSSNLGGATNVVRYLLFFKKLIIYGLATIPLNSSIIEARCDGRTKVFGTFGIAGSNPVASTYKLLTILLIINNT